MPKRKIGKISTINSIFHIHIFFYVQKSKIWPSKLPPESLQKHISTLIKR